MLRTGIALGCFSALISLSLASACTGTQDDCANTSTCSTGGSSAAGSAGKSGNGGKSGSPGGGSTSGDAGETTGGTPNGGGTSGTSGMAGAGGGGGGSGTECDTTKSPTEEACLVSDDYAIFVAPDGDDGNVGSKGSPLASITKAVEVAAGDKIILVCSGNYDEHVSITASAHVFGGFKCADWSADSAKPLFKPTTTGPALKIDTVADELLIESVSFEVGDATTAGETVLTAIVNASPKVTLRSVSLTAGKAKAGANGTLTGFTFPEATSLNGNPETTAGSGGTAKTCMCQATLSSTGGLGGAPVAGGQSGSKGQPDHGGGAPGIPATCGSGGTGQDGNDAPNGDAAAGASVLGTPSASGWQPAPGLDGLTGQPGQGGGGGASRNDQGHGGGGGCGGCGGNAGTAGKGGGGSIALLALSSPVVLESSTLTTADAGNGGTGAAGEAAKADVGAGAGVVSSLNSCPGGNGGKGGAGGAGGGGAGGVSAGIVWKGAVAPTVSVDTTVTIGKAGTKGAGGIPGTNDGIAGVAQKVLPLN